MPAYDIRPLPEKPDGNLYIWWTEGRRSKRLSTRTRDMAEAQGFLARWLTMERTAEERPETIYTVEDLWKVYRKKHVEREVAGVATVDYSWKNLCEHFGGLTVPEVNQDAVDEYERKRVAGCIGRPAKPQTVRRELVALFAALNFCADPRYGQKLFSPALIEKVKLPDPGEPRDRWLRTEEIQRLLAAAAEMRRGKRMSRGERFLWLALETAGRKQALLELTWDRVDFETNVIHLDVPGRKRTKKRRASVPISRALRPVLERAKREKINEYVLDNQAPIWATIQHIAINAGFSKQEVEHGKKPRATGISPHVLRHTAATHMARRGVPLWKIAKILGNTLAMVERVYAKHSPDDLREAVDMISSGELEAAE